MIFKPAATLALALFAALPVSAGVRIVDFETPASFESIANHYAAIGVTFGADVLALQNDDLGPYFSNAPSPLGVMTVVGSDATMNVEGGFLMLSFAYSSLEAIADAVQVWSGLNGTGTMLGSLSLAANATAGGCTDSPLCNFDTVGLGRFSEYAYSVTFGGAAFVAVFDDVTLVPAPATALLAGLGLALAGVASARRR